MLPLLLLSPYELEESDRLSTRQTLHLEVTAVSNTLLVKVFPTEVGGVEHGSGAAADHWSDLLAT